MKTSKYRVEPGSNVDLSDWDPDDDGGFERAEAEAETEALNLELEALQEKLYAEGKHKVLVVLQAIDAGGKDSTIRKVFEHVNPQGVKVASFPPHERTEVTPVVEVDPLAAPRRWPWVVDPEFGCVLVKHGELVVRNPCNAHPPRLTQVRGATSPQPQCSVPCSTRARKDCLWRPFG